MSVESELTVSVVMHVGTFTAKTDGGYHISLPGVVTSLFCQRQYTAAAKILKK